MRLTVAHGNALEADVLGELRLLFDELDELVNRFFWVGLGLLLTTAVVISGVVVAPVLGRDARCGLVEKPLLVSCVTPGAN